MTRKVIITVLACLLLGIPPAFAEDALILTVGALNLAHDHQTIAGHDAVLKPEAAPVYGVAWERRHYNGIAYGAEYLTYSNPVDSAGASGHLTSRLVMFTLKKYHRPWAHVYPFVGVSAGLADTSVSGVPGGTGLGPAFEIDGGVELQWARSVGFYTELRGLYVPSGTVYGTNANVSGLGLSAGISLLF